MRLQGEGRKAGRIPQARDDAADLLLRDLHGDYYVVLSGQEQEFVDFLWRRRHIHMLPAWAERLEQIASAAGVARTVS